ncbi:uncharacterized protein N7487_000639 [Penicillium crustosum]|uniref:uncharacterized protein n=1 Tax=Penicillium crustosum TaxID=36656 RepID=UPI00238455A6|nr:uncharacterized protein N7487_000639 [Penicillium crustosum]KAJ5417089.1 hypothetical protein N7487_000639 [Penicillium crustosum]
MSQPAEPQLIELAEWARPWLSGILPTRMVEQIPAGSPQPQSQDSSLCPPNDSLSLISSPSLASTNPDDTMRITKLPDIHLVVTLGRERTVSRALRGVHLFMITVNATLGTGLYWRGGQILELGGPLAVVLSFLFIGVLTWGVMQCITEMLCIWPIPGALSVYVSQFVDEELGIAVGITYWFVYSMSFSTLVATSAAEFSFWDYFNDSPVIQGCIIYFGIPLMLVIFNAIRIEIYGWLEVATGSIKILFLGVIIVTLIAINLGDWAFPTEFDTRAANNWGTALLMSISIATFAYTGVEVVAASALEAKWPQPTDETSKIRSNDAYIGKSFKFSARFIPLLAMVAYTTSGLVATFDIERTSCDLPRLSWLSLDPSCAGPSNSAAFVAIAKISNIPHMADVFNAFLVFTCLSCAATNLYVASRTLFGLTSRLDVGKGQRWYLYVLAWFGKTDRRQVPLRAMIFSAVAFWWVPFLQLIRANNKTQSSEKTTESTLKGSRASVDMFVEVLSQMAYSAVLIVWACECLAFIRYYHCISQHRHYLERDKVPHVQRWSEENHDEYPYRSHRQPFTAYLSLLGCIFVSLVANGAALWNGFHLLPFLASYLTVIVFVGLWVLLKIMRGAKWSLVDLSHPGQVIKIFKHLNDIRLGVTQS